MLPVLGAVCRHTAERVRGVVGSQEAAGTRWDPPSRPSLQLPRRASHRVRLFVGKLWKASEGVCFHSWVHVGGPSSFGMSPFSSPPVVSEISGVSQHTARSQF